MTCPSTPCLGLDVLCGPRLEPIAVDPSWGRPKEPLVGLCTSAAPSNLTANAVCDSDAGRSSNCLLGLCLFVY